MATLDCLPACMHAYLLAFLIAIRLKLIEAAQINVVLGFTYQLSTRCCPISMTCSTADKI
jgi:hypothetical protein